MTSKMMVERLRALGDVSSPYYQMVNDIVRDGAVAQSRAEEARVEVVVPANLTRDERVKLERLFGWKLKVRDYGVHSRTTQYVNALIYLMSLRNTMMMGSDGEEAIYIDGDLPSMVAKGMSYGHICRTHASNRLTASYAFQMTQLEQLRSFTSGGVAISAQSMLQCIEAGDETRVCSRASECRRMADTIFLNHAVTPCSLRQAVATARAHCATVIRGVCFFQPEMMVKETGEIEAFDGVFYVDRSADVISFVPREDPAGSFSHPYSSLMSFFYNHEFVDGDERWLVEKHMSGNGIFHYLARQQAVQTSFTDVLSVNYYTRDMTQWVYLTYTSFWDPVSGSVSGRGVRKRVPLLEYVYEKIMPALMNIDIKRLTFENVFSMLKNHNNMVFAAGDVVRKPQRVWYDDLKCAVVPLCAMATVRRAATSFELRKSLELVKTRASLGDGSTAAMLWFALQATYEAIRDVSVTSIDAEQVASLAGLDSGGVDVSVSVEHGVDHVTCEHDSGAERAGLGRMDPWLPGSAPKRFDLLSRAREFAATVGTSIHSSLTSSGSSVAEVSVGEDYRHVRGGMGIVTELELDKTPVPIEVSGLRKDALHKLMAQHDARSLVRPPRIVSAYEGPERIDVDVTPPPALDAAVAMQEDYDRAFPGVSLSDEEIKPVMLCEADFHKNTEMYGEINDSKRVIARPKVIRRSRLRGGASGKLPKTQRALLGGVYKRNVGIPTIRGFVALDTIADTVVDQVIATTFRTDWQKILAEELDAGLWLPNVEDLEEYIPKVPSTQLSVMLNEILDSSDENFKRWLLMLKDMVKPPMDKGAADKVPQAQTIVYSEQKSVNAKYSAMQTRFYHVMKRMMRSNVSFNNRDSPEEHEVWFNSLQGIRNTCERVYGYEGDLSCYDRSQEHVLQVFEFAFYKRMGLDRVTLERWSAIHGEKKATSMMFGVVLHIFGTGISGIWNTLFRNGLCCLGAVVYSFQLKSDDFISLDVVGDDFSIEAVKMLPVARAVDAFALTFNLSAKLFGSDAMYICSKYWVRVRDWWYFVQDPVRRFEALGRAVDVSSNSDVGLDEKWVSLRSDLRHYDDALVMEALGEAVKQKMGWDFIPTGMIRGLSAVAADKQLFFDLFGPEEVLG